MSLTHIETIELGSSQASITFSSIPQDYDDLVLVHSIRTARNNNVRDQLVLSLNGSGSNFSVIKLDGNGSSAGSQSYAVGRFAQVSTTNATSNTFGNGSLYISNYTASQNKSFSADSVSEDNGSTAYQSIYAGLWSNTSAVTSLSFVSADAFDLLSGSTASLYGVTAGGDGTVTTS